jgi:hypothetical protein
MIATASLALSLLALLVGVRQARRRLRAWQRRQELQRRLGRL